MSISAALARMEADPAVTEVHFTQSSLHLVLTDGRALSAPLAWFRVLRDASAEQRDNWRLIGDGHGVHWPDIDEDVSVRALLGQPT